MNAFTNYLRRKGAWIAVFMVILIGATTVFYNPDRNDKRKAYHKLLKEMMAAVPHMGNEKEKAAGQPGMAALQDYVMTLDPALGYVPRERLQQAYRELKANQNSNYKSTASLEWSGTEANMGGRTRAIMWDPNDPAVKKVWAGGVTGGLWYRNDITNDQSQWQPVNDFWSSLNISCITYDPNDPMTFYVGTGEAQTAVYIYRESSGTGDGIWKSADGGLTWNLLESSLDFEYVTDLRVRDENGTSVIYAGVASGLYHGVVHQSEPSDGLFRSEDGGQTWEQVLPDIPGYGAPYTVADIDFAADRRIFVGTMQNVEIEGGATILFSDEGTEGSWTVYDDYVAIIESHYQYNIPARVMLACAPSDANIVYAALAAGYNDGFNYYRGRYIIKTTNKGQTWSQISIPDSDWSTLAWHALVIEVDPNNPNTIFTGGLDMWKTTTSGNSWTKISDWSLMYYGGGDEYLHADQHALEFKPGSSSEFITSDDGGVFYTSSATGNSPVFQQKNQGYNTLQFYTCDLHSDAGEPMYLGGLQDNGTLLYQDEPLSIFNMVDGGDGAFCFFDKDNPDMFITSVYYNRYSVFLNGQPLDYLDFYSGIFINPADYDSDNNTLYANAVDFFGGSPNTILRISGIGQNYNGNFIGLQTGTDVYFSHVKVSPHSPVTSTHLFLGTQTGQVFRVINAQASPSVTEITGSDFPAAYVSCVAVGQTEDKLMVCFSNYGVQSVWLTGDGGVTWRDVEGNLPDIPVRWAIFHPENDGQALLATELGVWSTTELNNDQVTWNQDINGLANVRVDMLQMRTADNTVLAATHGRGFYTAEYPVDPYVAIAEKESPEITIYPNPSPGDVNFRFPSSVTTDAIVVIYDASGKKVYETTITKANILHDLRIDLGNQPKGNYLVTVTTDRMKYSGKVVIE